MRVLVCGGRDYKDRNHVFDVLDALHHKEPIRTIIHGHASGADTLGGQWAITRKVPVETYAADFERHGSSAGFIRNMEMLEKGLPDLVVAFPGGRGTKNMVWLSRRKGVKVMEVGHVPA